MTDKYKCFYCGKKYTKANPHWSYTCVKINGHTTVHFYACDKCFEKYIAKELNNDR